MVCDDVEDEARYTGCKGTDVSHLSYHSTTEGKDSQASDNEYRRNSEFPLGRHLEIPYGDYREC